MRWEKGMVSIYELWKPRPRTKYTIKALELFRPLLSRPVLKPGLMAPAESPGSFVLHFLGCILDPRIHVKKMESWSLGVTLIQLLTFLILGGMHTADQCSHHTSWRTWLPSSYPKWTDALGAASSAAGEMQHFIQKAGLIPSCSYRPVIPGITGLQFKNQVERLGFLTSIGYFGVPWLLLSSLTGPSEDWKWRYESAASCVWWARGRRFLWPEGTAGWHSNGDGISFHWLGSGQRGLSVIDPCMEWCGNDDSACVSSQ